MLETHAKTAVGKQRGLRRKRAEFVNTTPVQLALRELRTLLGARKTQGVLVALIALLAFSGPFGTIDFLPFAPRLIYWAVIVVLTYCSGMLVFFLTHNKTRRLWQAALINGMLNGILVSLILLTVNWVAMHDMPFDLSYMMQMLSYSFGVSIIVFAVLGMLGHLEVAESGPQSPAILQRLELNKRGALVSMTVQDHYVEVTTTKGTSLLLMRLSDAIGETGPTQGFQIHRSHWVAMNQIENIRRQGDRAIVTLKNGSELPASRSNLKQLKDAGLLL